MGKIPTGNFVLSGFKIEEKGLRFNSAPSTVASLFARLASVRRRLRILEVSVVHLDAVADGVGAAIFNPLAVGMRREDDTDLPSDI
jgi:hypothetical protein